jgi:DNA-binding FrmR family transcriptional regulator
MAHEHSAPPGYQENKKQHLNRLRRIEGQVRGIQRMVDDEEYCIDVLTQIAAINKGLHAVAIGLLQEHLGHCVADAVAHGGDALDQKIEEATKAVDRLLKS